MAQQIVQLVGGLDLVTPSLAIKEGKCIGCLNYESEARGYRRIGGYERYDGQPKPSAATYVLLNFDAGSTEIAEDDTVTGATSGATGIAIATVVDSGTWAGGDAAGYVVLYNHTGTFQDNENLQVSASPVAVANGTGIENGAATDALNDSYLASARSKRRSAIAAVPGSGPIRGGFTYKGDLYVIRDNVGGTAAVLHKATSSGWSAQSFGSTIAFDAGTAAFSEGETLTGGTSGATATIERVVHQTGTWAGTDADGYLVLSGVSGTFSDNETITSAAGSATANGADAAVTWAAGGTYRAIEHNFYGASDLKRAYIVSGTQRAMEWDGSVMAPIETGVETSLDKPTFVAVMREHLFLGFDGGALFFSGTGLPLSFQAVDGAGQAALGDSLTGMRSQNKDALIITGRNRVAYLTGNNSTDFQLKTISTDSGAVENTLEVVGRPYFLDDMGIRDLEAAQSFGDWRIGTITSMIEPLIREQRTSGKTPIALQRVRSKDLMRLWYDDGTGISIYIGRSQPECMQFKVGFTPTWVYSGEDANGYEVLFAGDDAGMVYQLDSGNSFDGGEVEAFLRPAFLHQGSPSQYKRYLRAYLDVLTDEESTVLSFASDFTFGDSNHPSGVETSQTVYGGGGFWDTMIWNKFNWSAPFESDTVIELHGIGRNLSLVFMSDNTEEKPHVLASLSVTYSPRRQRR